MSQYAGGTPKEWDGIFLAIYLSRETYYSWDEKLKRAWFLPGMNHSQADVKEWKEHKNSWIGWVLKSTIILMKLMCFSGCIFITCTIMFLIASMFSTYDVNRSSRCSWVVTVIIYAHFFLKWQTSAMWFTPFLLKSCKCFWRSTWSPLCLFVSIQSCWWF